jgi:hypothetical protein
MLAVMEESWLQWQQLHTAILFIVLGFFVCNQLNRGGACQWTAHSFPWPSHIHFDHWIMLFFLFACNLSAPLWTPHLSIYVATFYCHDALQSNPNAMK